VFGECFCGKNFCGKFFIRIILAGNALEVIVFAGNFWSEKFQ
jgi:hypothetical protein